MTASSSSKITSHGPERARHGLAYRPALAAAPVWSAARMPSPRQRSRMAGIDRREIGLARVEVHRHELRSCPRRPPRRSRSGRAARPRCRPRAQAPSRRADRRSARPPDRARAPRACCRGRPRSEPRAAEQVVREPGDERHEHGLHRQIIPLAVERGCEQQHAPGAERPLEQERRAVGEPHQHPVLGGGRDVQGQRENLAARSSSTPRSAGCVVSISPIDERGRAPSARRRAQRLAA